MIDLLDHAIKEKYNSMKINDPLIFVKNAIDWDAFTPLLNDLYHNGTDNGGRPNIPVKIMVKVLFLQSMFNMVDEQAETLIKDRISFMNFLDYPDQYPDARTIWLFRERLSKTGKYRIIWNELQRQLELKGIKVKKGSARDATFITSYPGHVKHDEPRSDGKTRRSRDGSFTKKNSKTFFGYKGHTIVDDNIPVPMIRSYAVSTAKDHDTTDEDEINFGKLYLLSDLNEEPERIYRLYKQREYVEYSFNVYRNDLEADRSYLRDDHMLFTYMFLNLLSLYLHFQIMNMIDGRYSVRDVLLILSRIKIYRMESGDIMSEIPKKAKELVSDLNIDLDILRK